MVEKKIIIDIIIPIKIIRYMEKNNISPQEIWDKGIVEFINNHKKKGI